MIEAKALVKDYGALRAVDNITFTVNRGEILGFLGPNGAGKSTTMKMITGFLPPTAGTAAIGGYDVRENPLPAKRLLGYLPESGPLYHEMTVLEFLRFAAAMRDLHGAAADSAIARVVEICHLDRVRHQPIDTLSKGFRQRVGLAQAVIHEPPCLIMDEPTDGLDPNQKAEVRKLIASMSADKAIILSTHILEEVESMCTRVIIIAGGKLVADATPAALRQRHPNFGAVKLSLGAGARLGEAREAVAGLKEVERCTEENGALHVFPRQAEVLTAKLWELAKARQWSVNSIENLPCRLDEVFRELTSRQFS